MSCIRNESFFMYLIFYVDGKETWRTGEGGVSHVPAYLKLTVEIGKWAGDIK